MYSEKEDCIGFVVLWMDHPPAHTTASCAGRFWDSGEERGRDTVKRGVKDSYSHGKRQTQQPSTDGSGI